MEWSARVEWSTPEPYTVDDLDALITKLEPQFPMIGREPVPADPTFGPEVWGAHIWLEAPDMRAGFEEALRLIEEATGFPASGIELIDWQTFEFRVELPGPVFIRYVEGPEIDIDLGEQIKLMADEVDPI